MNNRSFVLLLVFLSILMLTSCSAKKSISGYYSHKTECLGIELDGSQTVKAWGTGKNRSDALEQAKKNAVRDVLFNGIIEGKAECENRPVVSEVNAQLKYEQYFTIFFADGGEYRKFISMKDQPFRKDVKGTAGNMLAGVIVNVRRSELKQKMISDSILK